MHPPGYCREGVVLDSTDLSAVILQTLVREY